MAYATPSDCKALSGLAAVQAKTDPELEAFIARAEIIVNAWTRQRFDLSISKSIRVTGSGSRRLVLPERLAVLVKVDFLDLDDGGTIVLARTEVKDIFNKGWYLIAEGNFQTPRARKDFGSFPDQEENIEVTGQFGYASVPEEVKNATCFVVEKTVFNQGEKSSLSDLKSERIGDYMYVKQDVGEQTPKQEIARLIPAEARLILRQFMKPLLPEAV